MINFQLIEKFLFPKKIDFFRRLFFIIINGLLELIGISLLLFFIKIISSSGEIVSILNYNFETKNISDVVKNYN